MRVPFSPGGVLFYISDGFLCGFGPSRWQRPTLTTFDAHVLICVLTRRLMLLQISTREYRQPRPCSHGACKPTQHSAQASQVYSPSGDAPR